MQAQLSARVRTATPGRHPWREAGAHHRRVGARARRRRSLPGRSRRPRDPRRARPARPARRARDRASGRPVAARAPCPRRAAGGGRLARHVDRTDAGAASRPRTASPGGRVEPAARHVGYHPPRRALGLRWAGANAESRAPGPRRDPLRRRALGRLRHPPVSRDTLHIAARARARGHRQRLAPHVQGSHPGRGAATARLHDRRLRQHHGARPSPRTRAGLRPLRRALHPTAPRQPHPRAGLRLAQPKSARAVLPVRPSLRPTPALLAPPSLRRARRPERGRGRCGPAAGLAGSRQERRGERRRGPSSRPRCTTGGRSRGTRPLQGRDRLRRRPTRGTPSVARSARAPRSNTRRLHRGPRRELPRSRPLAGLRSRRAPRRGHAASAADALPRRPPSRNGVGSLDE